MCAGDPGSRETSTGCVDRQRPAPVPLLAWEQAEPQQPHQESPTYCHQVAPRRVLHNNILVLFVHMFLFNTNTLSQCNIQILHFISPSNLSSTLRSPVLSEQNCRWLCSCASDNEHTLTLSTAGLLDVLPHNITLIWKKNVEPEFVSHVFILLSFRPEFSTSHFPFCDVQHAHPFIFSTGQFYWPFSHSLPHTD